MSFIQSCVTKSTWTPNHYTHTSGWTSPSNALGIRLLLTTSTGKAFLKSLQPGCRDLLSFSHKTFAEVGCWCSQLKPGSRSAFQFIAEMQDRVWGQRPVQAGQFAPHQTIDAFPKSLPGSWRHTHSLNTTTQPWKTAKNSDLQYQLTSEKGCSLRWLIKVFLKSAFNIRKDK